MTKKEAEIIKAFLESHPDGCYYAVLKKEAKLFIDSMVDEEDE